MCGIKTRFVQHIMTMQGGGRVPMILEVYERDLRTEQK
jgi:hypothetical protein